jgi:isopentenyl-diphosphate delta-isomerase
MHKGGELAMKKIEGRKADHINICLNEQVTQDYDYWNDVKFIHEALPEVDLAAVDTSAWFLRKKLDFPFIVTAITGGFAGAKKINANIAQACAELGIGMGIGSERAGIDGTETESYSVIKDYGVPLVIGNIGAPQLVRQGKKGIFKEADVQKAMDLVGADCIAVHLNFLQEVVQPEGDTNSAGCFDAIRDLALRFPVIVKETGAGMTGETAKRLSCIGVQAIDIGGMGGTSFSAIEMHRAIDAGDELKAEMGRTFSDWGIPAPVSLMSCAGMTQVPLIASGGIRSGLDVARAVALGAACAGGAGFILKDATESAEAVKKRLLLVREELRAAMMLTGSPDIGALSNARHILVGRTREWRDELL